MTFDIKQELDRSLDGVEPMPDLIPAILAQGPRRVRRHRVLVSAGAALSTLAVVAAGLTVAPMIQTEPPEAATTTTLAPIPEVLSYDEFRRYAAETLSVLLPDQFDAVQVSQRGDLSVQAGGVRFPITFDLAEPMADFPSPGSRCTPQGVLIKGTRKYLPDQDECQVKQLTTGGLAMVRRTSTRQEETRENGLVVVRPAGFRTAWLTIDHHGLGLRLVLFPDDKKGSAPINGDQLLAIAADQRMTHLLDVWSTHLSSKYQWVNRPTTPPTPR